MRLFYRIVLALVVGFGFRAESACAQTNFTSVVVFGDSLSDTGNIAHLTGSQYEVRYPADNQLLGFNYTDGRFTDGPDTQPAASTAYTGVWIEQLVKLFGANVAVKNSLDGGTDYAYGDATTGNGTTTESRTFLSLPVMITLDNMGQQVTTYLGTNPTPNATTLYVLWGGGNDLLNAATTGQDPVAAAQTAVANELALVQRLAAAGATNFMLPNLPPLGAFAPGASPAVVTQLNTASGVFAQALTAGLNALKQSSMMTTLNFFQPNVFGLFGRIANTPMALGFSNITSPAQGVSGSPDTYLSWDGLHPTTTGHHYVAATAANLFSPLVTSTTALTAPAGVIAGGSATVSAAVASSKSGTVATGLVAFFSGTTLIGSGPLNASGTATLTFTPAGTAGTDVPLTAVYAGDVVNEPSSSAAGSIALLSAAVMTTTTVTSSSANANVGGAVTFTATVTPAVATYGTPGGTVTFLDGTTTLGTGTLNSSGVATYVTSALGAGTQSITATYAGAGLFAGSTSAALSETVTAPGFTATASPTSLTIASGGSGTVNLTVTLVGGYTGAVTPACGTLPAHFSCSFAAPANQTTGGTSGFLLSIATDAGTMAAARNEPMSRPGSWPARVWTAGLLLPGTFGLLGVGLRRRRTGLGGRHLTLGVAMFFGAALLGLAGCGSGASNNAAPGSYTVPVVFTATSTSSGPTVAPQTVNIAVTVQ